MDLEYVYTEKDLKRFLSYVNREGPIKNPDLGPCWPWTGGTAGKLGYGEFFLKGYHCIPAHRFALFLVRGPYSPDKPLSCHACDYPLCVRFDHLFPGSYADNTHDAMGKHKFGRPSQGKLIALETAKGVVYKHSCAECGELIGSKSTRCRRCSTTHLWKSGAIHGKPKRE